MAKLKVEFSPSLAQHPTKQTRTEASDQTKSKSPKFPSQEDLKTSTCIEG